MATIQDTLATRIAKTVATGSAAIATSVLVPAGQVYRVVSVALHLSAAPTTSENLTITLNSATAAAYDTLLYTLDPSSVAATNVLWQPDALLYLVAGDSLDVAWTNTNTRTYGLTVTMEVM
jgi:hypothetical protein